MCNFQMLHHINLEEEVVKDNFFAEIRWEIEKYISSALMEIDIGRILISGKETLVVGMYYRLGKI